MANGNSVFKDLESKDKVPENLKNSIMAEMDVARNTMVVATHFTENFLATGRLCLMLAFDDDPL